MGAGGDIEDYSPAAEQKVLVRQIIIYYREGLLIKEQRSSGRGIGQLPVVPNRALAGYEHSWDSRISDP